MREADFVRTQGVSKAQRPAIVQTPSSLAVSLRLSFTVERCLGPQPHFPLLQRRLSQKLRRFFRRDRIDVESCAPFETCHMG